MAPKYTNIWDLITYLHAAALIPDISKLIYEVQWRYFSIWSELTTANIIKYLPKTEENTKVNMDQNRKHKIYKTENPGMGDNQGCTDPRTKNEATN